MTETFFGSADEPNAYNSSKLTVGQFEKLVSNHPGLIRTASGPGGSVSRSLDLSGRIDELGAKCKEFVDALAEVGVDVFGGTSSSQRGWIVSRTRKYSDTELSQCPYMICYPDPELGEATLDYEHDADGIPHLKSAVIPLSRQIGRIAHTGGSGITVVRGEAKARLERSGMKGLKLVEPVYKGRKMPADEEKVWVVWSDIILPPMKNLCMSNDGHVFRYADRDLSRKGCGKFEGFLSWSEFHFKASDFAALGDFDIAVTAERFGYSDPMEPEVVMSQRFYQFLKNEIGVELIGRPVHVDEDDTIPWGGPYPPPWEHLNQRPKWLKEFEKK